MSTNTSEPTSIIQTNQHLRSMTREEQIEFLTETMAQNAVEGVRAVRRLEEIADRFEGLLKSLAKVLVEQDRQKWEEAIERAVEGQKTHG